MEVRTKDLPLQIQPFIDKQRVSVEPCTECTVGVRYHDLNKIDVTVVDLLTGKHQTAEGWYGGYAFEHGIHKALADGLKLPIPNLNIWVIESNSYPKMVRVYCHPDAMAPLLTETPWLSLELKVALFIIRAFKSFARVEESRNFGFSPLDFEVAKTELRKLGYLNRAGAITVEGRNVIGKEYFNPWDVREKIKGGK